LGKKYSYASRQQKLVGSEK